MTDLEALVRWYLTLSLVAAGLLPFIAWLAAPLGPARYGLVRSLSLVILTGIVWWPAAAVGIPFSRASLAMGLVAVLLAGWWRWSRARFDGFNLRWLLLFEALWLVLFIGYAWFRSYQPDIINTEKPMEVALLSSISRSSDVPAPDPWFAGEPINYYYFGFQMFATVIKLARVPVGIAFNLALASVFASTGVAVLASGMVLARLVRLPRAAVIAASALSLVFVLFSGNLETARLLTRDARVVDAGWWDGVGWPASRVIVDHDVHEVGDVRATINEFPAFSFVLGDLHPHVLTYPLLASVVALALGLAMLRVRHSTLRLLAVGALVGLLYASNSWDAPAGLLVVVLGLVLAHGRDWRTVLSEAAYVVVGALIVVAPFLVQFDAPVGIAASGVPEWISAFPIVGALVNTFGVVTWRPSGVGEILIVHGLWIAGFLAFAGVAIARHRGAYVRDAARSRHALFAASLIAAGVAIAWAPAVILIGAPLALAAWLAVRAPEHGPRIVSALFAAGFLLILIPEFVYIQDVFADRMNTVFKLYFQAWLLLGLATAAGLVFAIQGIRIARPLPAVVGAALIAATLTYTPLSAWDWTNGFAEYRGLDGGAYIGRAAPGDAAAIAWISEHARDGDTIVEAPGCSYNVAGGVPMDRVSAFSGVPTVIGWLGHEGQWRRGQDPEIWATLDRRAQEANLILDGRMRAANSAARFVVLGSHEIEGAANCSLAPARGEQAASALRAAGWTPVFESGGARIFTRPDDPLASSVR